MKNERIDKIPGEVAHSRVLREFSVPYFVKNRILRADQLNGISDSIIDHLAILSSVVAGTGILQGLRIEAGRPENCGEVFVITKGVAIDPNGRIIIVPDDHPVYLEDLKRFDDPDHRRRKFSVEVLLSSKTVPPCEESPEAPLMIGISHEVSFRKVHNAKEPKELAIDSDLGGNRPPAVTLGKVPIVRERGTLIVDHEKMSSYEYKSSQRVEIKNLRQVSQHLITDVVLKSNSDHSRTSPSNLSCGPFHVETLDYSGSSKGGVRLIVKSSDKSVRFRESGTCQWNEVIEHFNLVSDSYGKAAFECMSTRSGLFSIQVEPVERPNKHMRSDFLNFNILAVDLFESIDTSSTNGIVGDCVNLRVRTRSLDNASRYGYVEFQSDDNRGIVLGEVTPSDDCEFTTNWCISRIGTEFVKAVFRSHEDNSEIARINIPVTGIGSRIRIIQGDGQLGVSGFDLPNMIKVKVERDDGCPIPHAMLEVACLPSGTMTSDPCVELQGKYAPITHVDGESEIRWNPGMQGLNVLRIRHIVSLPRDRNDSSLQETIEASISDAFVYAFCSDKG